MGLYNIIAAGECDNPGSNVKSYHRMLYRLGLHINFIPRSVLVDIQHIRTVSTISINTGTYELTPTITWQHAYKLLHYQRKQCMNLRYLFRLYTMIETMNSMRTSICELSWTNCNFRDLTIVSVVFRPGPKRKKRRNIFHGSFNGTIRLLVLYTVLPKHGFVSYFQ